MTIQLIQLFLESTRIVENKINNFTEAAKKREYKNANPTLQAKINLQSKAPKLFNVNAVSNYLI